MSAARLLLAIALLAPLGCSTKSGNNNYLGPTGGAGTSGTGGAGPNDVVTVVITAPGDQTSVNQNTALTVSAMVDDSGPGFIDSTRVTATLTASGGTTALAVGQLTSLGNDVYSGMITIGALPSGTYTLTVSATSSGGATGHQSVSITVTGGPTLIVNSPVEGRSYNGSLTVEIVVDQGAMPPVATLAGQALMPAPTLAASVDGTDVYRVTIFFGPAGGGPSGVQAFDVLGPQLLDVTESDGNITSEVKRAFIIDRTGPSITNTFPQPGQLVGGLVTVSATVSDNSGVLPSSIVATIGDANGNPLFSLPLQPDSAGAYSALFDTRNLTRCPQPPATGPCIVFPTISFRATDSAGNESSLAYDFSLDNIAPLSDLVPPELRQMKLGMNGYQCSFLFDPLSVNQDIGDMPNDGCMVPQVFDLRARIEDQGNEPNGLKLVPISGIDPDNTAVYILTDNTQPLIVDSDGNGTCDTINPLLSPTTGPLTQSDQILKIRLSSVAPGGSADFRPDSTIPASYPCGPGTDKSPPKAYCAADGFEQPTLALAYANNDPAIWGVEPIDADRCFGNQLDTRANNIPDGQWICIAVQSADLIGNKGVSAAIRVYVKYDENGPFCATPPPGAGPPPTCTGTYDPVSKTAAPGTCTTLSFPSGEIYCAPGDC